ncbi:hypothetical protein [Streptomyces antibioticus]|uniref:hypothetical protein n=1 Tax=Streptomyces antibioticus TaxID=1890 RepID=UPI0033AC84FB
MAREPDLEVLAAAWSAGAAVLDVREPEGCGLRRAPGARFASFDPDGLSAADGVRGRVDSGRPVVAGTAPGPV